LRDWIFSRQRYWGEPIPIIFCNSCGTVPVPEKDLPVKLPEVKNYKPTDTGESPLANIKKWVQVKCPNKKCLSKDMARRETDVMPNWAGSSWYYLRYIDPKNKKEFASQKKLKYWLSAQGRTLGIQKGSTLGSLSGGVDWYNGGMEHTTLHLLYSRFWHKFLFDLKVVPTPEPYKKRTSHGMILGEGGVKMSKSLGNVVNPDEIVKIYGADTLRIYEMFMGPFEDAVAWSTQNIMGSRRFLEKVWRIGQKIGENSSTLPIHPTPTLPEGEGVNLTSPSPSGRGLGGGVNVTKLLHQTIKKVTQDIENMRFNTAISSMMILVSEMENQFSGKSDLSGNPGKSDLQKTVLVASDFIKFLQILSPFAPHISAELISYLEVEPPRGGLTSKWPQWDENLIKDTEIKIVAQINSKVRAEIMISADDSEEDVKKKVLENSVIQKLINENNIKKIIYVKNKLINIVI
ncbi:MAG: class I tRNA ligase family protein, partial [Patescibacteria group bacterium]